MAPPRPRPTGRSLLLALGSPVVGLCACRAFIPVGIPRTQPSAVSSAAPAGSQPSTPSGRALPTTAAALGLGLAAVAAAAGRKAVTSTRAEEEAKSSKAPPPPPPFDPAKQPGVTLPLNYFDPVGFCKVGDKDGFRQYRAAEIKHGRVAMMAALGSVIQHNIKLPGFEQVPSGIEAVTTPPGTYGLALLVVLSGGVELAVWTQDPEKEPGDFGDPLGIGQYYEEWRNRELNNGRMAMIAISGIVVAEFVSGKDGVEQIWGATAGNLPVE